MSGSQTGSGNQGGVPALLGDRYEIEVEIGAGAFATTYRGHDRRLDRTVAIKVLSREYARDPSYAQRFEREAQTAASISHGNVVDVYDFGQQGDTLYIVMQYVAGEDLKHLITREGPLSPDRARDIAIQILDGLDAIHRAGIIHRDIKPQNILIGADGRARVADFGIAQIELDSGLTTAGTTIGTAAYMAPEQAEGGRTTAETDLYAVGVVLYEMLTGALPFSAPTAMALMLAHIQQQPVPPSQRVRGRTVPPDLDGIVMQAMAKSPQDRFRSAAAMMQALRGVRATARGQEPTMPLASPRSGTTRLPAGPPARARPASAGAMPRRAPRVETPVSTSPAPGGGFMAFLGRVLLVILAGLILAAAYVWWDGRQNDAGVDGTETPTATATRPAPTSEVTVTDQVILPAATDPPTAMPTALPTDVPLPTATAVPPTVAPPTDSAPTIGPGATEEPQIIEPASG